MVLAILAFAVFKILDSLASVQKALLAITTQMRKITKSVPFDLTFNFIELSEKANSFVKI